MKNLNLSLGRLKSELQDLISSPDLIEIECRFDRAQGRLEYRAVVDAHTVKDPIVVKHRIAQAEDDNKIDLLHDFTEKFDDVDAALACFDEIELTK